MTRSERKRTKRKKRQPPQTKTSNERMHLLATAMSKVMTKMRPSKELVNKKVHCGTCNQSYCLGFDGVDQFCRDCFYLGDKEKVEASGGIFAGCLKEMTGRRICQHCKREN